MIKIPPGATVDTLVGYSLLSIKPVPMVDGLLQPLNTLPANRYSPPITGWINPGGKVYFMFDNPATYPKSIFMPMAGGYWDGYKYEIGAQAPTPVTVTPNLAPAVGATGLIIGALAAFYFLK